MANKSRAREGTTSSGCRRWQARECDGQGGLTRRRQWRASPWLPCRGRQVTGFLLITAARIVAANGPGTDEQDMNARIFQRNCCE